MINIRNTLRRICEIPLLESKIHGALLEKAEMERFTSDPEIITPYCDEEIVALEVKTFVIET